MTTPAIARPLAALCAVMAMILISAQPVAASSADKANRTMTLTGTGTVYAAPDTAAVGIGVITQGETADEATTANSAAMANVIDVLKSLGIEARDIRTSSFNISPRYVYPNRDNRDAPPRIAGYDVSNEIYAKVRDLTILGDVLDKAVRAGANRINSVSFFIDEAAELEDDARRRAVADARRKAQLYAEAADVTLGPVVSIAEAPVAAPFPGMPIMARSLSASPEAAPVPLEEGEQAITMRITITWALE